MPVSTSCLTTTKPAHSDWRHFRALQVGLGVEEKGGGGLQIGLGGVVVEVKRGRGPNGPAFCCDGS